MSLLKKIQNKDQEVECIKTKWKFVSVIKIHGTDYSNHFAIPL